MKLTGNNLIVVNVLATYVRILFVAGLGLFSTRWVLQALGKEDFGLYSVVGGLIVFILFIGNTMAGSVQRFYAYAIGQGDPEEVKRWFNCAFMLHAGFSILLVLMGIPFGNYLLDHIMQIPLERLETCRWVYYLSIIGAVGTMMTAPYLGMFYAKQRIFELSLWGVLQATLMFSFALYILKVSGDVLLFYSIGIVGLKLVFDFIQIIRAWILFNVCRLNQSYWFSRKRAIKLASFVGWNLFGNCGAMLRNQGLAFLINIYSGAKVNAAFGIANQVTNATGQISTAIYGAIAPEITSREGAGSRRRMISLSLRTSKFCTLVALLWLIPLFVEIEYILGLWLNEVPEFAVVFCRIMFLTYIMDKCTIGYLGAVNAHGKIAGYQFILGSTNILAFPLAWLVFILGGSPFEAVLSALFTKTITTFLRIWWVKKLMDIPMFYWVSEVFVKCLYVVVPSIVVVLLVDSTFSVSLHRFIILSFFTCLSTTISAWFFAFDNEERSFISSKMHIFC